MEEGRETKDVRFMRREKLSRKRGEGNRSEVRTDNGMRRSRGEVESKERKE